MSALPRLVEVKAVLATLQAPPDTMSSDQIVEALVKLVDLTCDALNSAAAIAERDGIRIVLDVMKHDKWKRTPAIQSKGCHVLGNLSYNNYDNKERITEQGGIHVAVRALYKWPGNADMQYNGLFCLGSLASPEANMRVITDLGGVELAVKALRSWRDDAGIQSSALYALGSLVHLDDNKRTVARNGGVALVIDALSHNVENTGVQSWGLLALSNLSRLRGVDAQVADNGAIALAVRAMKMFPQNQTVQRNGTSLLYHLAINTDLIPSLKDQQAMDVVLSAKRNFPTKIKIQDNCKAFLLRYQNAERTGTPGSDSSYPTLSTTGSSSSLNLRNMPGRAV